MIIEAEYEEVEPTGDELDLVEDDSLPWLEADEEDEDAGGVDTAQIVAFLLILLTILALVVGGVAADADDVRAEPSHAGGHGQAESCAGARDEGGLAVEDAVRQQGRGVAHAQSVRGLSAAAPPGRW